LGSIRALTNGSGAVVRTADYDAYGQVVSTSGSTSTPFGYAGEYRDTETGFLYLRARYYDPATQQFLTVDPLFAATEQAYTYAGGSPLNATDPAGLCDWSHAVECIEELEGGGGAGRGGADTGIILTAEGIVPGETLHWDYGSGEPVYRGASKPLAYNGGTGRGNGLPSGGSSSPNTTAQTGEFCIINWKGYPNWGVPKPQGPFKILTGPSYDAARRAADAANRSIHRNGGSLLDDMEIHEVHPVKFGGSPTDPNNKIALPGPIHDEYTTWWNALRKALTRR
jgi:RHS repeat-associated protein